MVELEHAWELLGSMGLETAATLLDAQMERFLHGEHTYAQFLNELLTSEQQERGRKGEKMRTKLARLPNRKSLEEFDFSLPSTNGRLTSWPRWPLPPVRKTLSCWGRPASARPIWLWTSP